MIVRKATELDKSPWVGLRMRLWPDGTIDEHYADVARTVSRQDAAAFIACSDAGEIVGFLEVRMREYANGCNCSPVAFVEGVYVVPECRKSGVACLLFRAAEDWARGQGSSELGSDTEIHNISSQEVHRRLGFEETERVVYFRKILA